MLKPRLPSQFYSDEQDLRFVFLKLAADKGIVPGAGERLFALLPSRLENVRAFRDRLTGLWRYDFGVPIELASHVVIGTHMFPPVARLLDVLSMVSRCLSGPRLSEYLERLSNPSKHQDVLAEFSPILRLKPGVTCEFEVCGFSAGNRTIDWLVDPPGMQRVIFDVKCRIADLVEGLTQIAAGCRSPDGTAPPPEHDPSLLFRSTEQKFLHRAPEEILQGVWVISQLKQERQLLHAAFDALDPKKIHFVVLANWQEGAYILSRNEAQHEIVAELFSLKHSEDFVFERLPEINTI